jgi:PAS domain S-box-containing protein
MSSVTESARGDQTRHIQASQVVALRDADAVDAQFTSLLEAVPDAMLIVGKDGRIALVNAQAESLFGYRREELIGELVERLIPERFRSSHPKHRAGLFAGSEGRAQGERIELCGLRKDGTELPVEISLGALPMAEGAMVAAAIRDISERKRLEHRTQEASRLKSEFLANMSHELRTPLNAIIGFAALMHSGKVGPMSADHHEYLGDILTSSRHLLQLINDILDLAKVESGKMELRPEHVDLGKVVGEVRDILRGLAASKHLRLVTQLDPRMTTAFIDSVRVKHVLYNYLSNAIKFTAEGGLLTIRIAEEGPEQFRLEVEDTGIGIAPEDIAGLFVEFQQLGAGRARELRGTGLGLSNTKKIVEAIGGRVEVRSTPGVGSTFSAIFRRTTSGAPPLQELPAPPHGAMGTEPVLVIEAEPRDRARLVDALRAAGYSVEEASTGREAIEKSKARRLSAITFDLLLPDGSGWDVVREIRSLPLNRDVPAIVVTVSAAQEGEMAGFLLHDYLVKPVSEEVLLSSLRRAHAAAAGTILVVDDDRASLRLAAALLRHIGYRSICAQDGEEGLRAALAEPLVAVVVDLLMPGMDGLEFIAQLRKSPACRAVPVIVWTAKDLTASERDRLRASAQAVVSKSIDGPATLLEVLRPFLTARLSGLP